MANLGMWCPYFSSVLTSFNIDDSCCESLKSIFFLSVMHTPNLSYLFKMFESGYIIMNVYNKIRTSIFYINNSNLLTVNVDLVFLHIHSL